MKLKTEVEEVHFVGNYRVIIRVNRYEKSKKSTTTAGAVAPEPDEKTETPAEFRVTVYRHAQRIRKTERPIEDIKKDAIAAVLQLCREIIASLGPETKTEN
jgi:hypothetical protein